MWRYEKRLQYPVKISQTNPRMAQFIMSQYGGLYCKNLQYFLFPAVQIAGFFLNYNILSRLPCHPRHPERAILIGGEGDRLCCHLSLFIQIIPLTTHCLQSFYHCTIITQLMAN